MTPPVLLRRDLAAAYLDVSLRTFLRLVEQREIRPVTVGRSATRYRVADLDAYVERIARAS